MEMPPQPTGRESGNHDAARRQEAALTRRRQAVGLLLLAGAILAAVLVRAPQHVLFPTGWWRF